MERDYQFDNYKAFLIILVVVGHFLFPLQEALPWTTLLRKLIFSFHMPAFIFISGYFARKNDVTKLVQKLLLPYFIMQLTIWAVRNIFGLPGGAFRMIQPYFTLWFLPCLFVWRLLIDRLERVPHLLWISLAAGILAGFLPWLGEDFSLSRMVGFFPYFVMGHCFEKEKFFQKAGKKKGLAAAGIAVIFLSIGLLNPAVAMRDFLLRGAYLSGKQLAGAGIRTLLYAMGTALTLFFLLLMPKEKTCISWLGSRTMSIYLFHGILEQAFAASPYVSLFESNLGGILVIVGAAALAFVLGLKPFHWLAGKICSVPVCRILSGH